MPPYGQDTYSDLSAENICPKCGAHAKEPKGRHERLLGHGLPVTVVSWDEPREGPLFVQEIKRWGKYFCCQDCSYDYWVNPKEGDAK